MQSGGGEDAVVQSGFTICEKCCVGLSEFAVAANQGSLFLISFVYTSIHGASATPLGVVDVVISFYELTNGPIFGHWADQGRFNIFCMKSRIWGRRAPQFLLAVPVSCAGFMMMVAGPVVFVGGSGVVVAVYAVAKVLIGTAMAG